MKKCKNICRDCLENKLREENIQQLIDLANMYLSEWAHRDSLMWKQVFSYFISCLVVMLVPFMSYFGIDFGGALSKWIFPVIGMILAVFFFIVSMGYAIRLQAVSETYQRIIEKLPKEMQRTRTSEVNKNFIFNANMSKLIVYVMFLSLLTIGVILLHLCW